MVQDEQTKDFAAQFWEPDAPFDWRGDAFEAPAAGSLLIYEAHVGMAQEREGVGTYREFTERILPVIKRGGYNAVQLMAIAEHPLLRVVRLPRFEFLRPLVALRHARGA